jgi:hypothetical protein
MLSNLPFSSNLDMEQGCSRLPFAAQLISAVQTLHVDRVKFLLLAAIGAQTYKQMCNRALTEIMRLGTALYCKEIDVCDEEIQRARQIVDLLQNAVLSN